MMKVTFILKNLTETFFEGNGTTIPGLNTMPDEEKLNFLLEEVRKKELKITAKIGDGSTRDGVEFNLMRRNPIRVKYKLEPRKGYKLAVFEVERVS